MRGTGKARWVCTFHFLLLRSAPLHMLFLPHLSVRFECFLTFSAALHHSSSFPHACCVNLSVKSSLTLWSSSRGRYAGAVIRGRDGGGDADVNGGARPVVSFCSILVWLREASG